MNTEELAQHYLSQMNTARVDHERRVRRSRRVEWMMKAAVFLIPLAIVACSFLLTGCVREASAMPEYKLVDLKTNMTMVHVPTQSLVTVMQTTDGRDDTHVLVEFPGGRIADTSCTDLDFTLENGRVVE